MRRRYVSQALLASMKQGGMAVLAILIYFTFAGNPAKADGCAISCRSQHNACRMAAKLLFSPRCDAQLQACISQCFAAGRFNRGLREGREFPALRDRDRRGVDVGGPPIVRGMPEIGGPPLVRGSPDMRGVPERGPPDRGLPEREPPERGFPNRGPSPGFRDLGEQKGPRWLGEPQREDRFRYR
jgi:hypothetical protein